MNISPLKDMVLLQKIENDKVGSLYLPDESADNVAKVKAIGEGVSSLSIGDRVVFNTFNSNKFSHNREEFILVNIKDILAVIKER